MTILNFRSVTNRMNAMDVKHHAAVASSLFIKVHSKISSLVMTCIHATRRDVEDNDAVRE